MGSVWLMKVCLIWVCVIFLETEGQEYFEGPQEWKVEYIQWSPDGVESVVIGINGKFPGPTIRARVNQEINIKLTNKLHTEGVVIHWHGITQRDTPWMDGTASISQCPINPGETFEYRFKVDKTGTYFYHGHYGMQRSAGLYGMLIVEETGEKEKLGYNEELPPLLLSDWWHKASHEQEVDLSSKPMRWIGEPQTLLINGRGQFGCSLAPPSTNIGDNSVAAPSSSNIVAGPACDIKGGEPYAPYILQVEPDKIYRLRIASSTALASLSFAIGGHKMTVVEADGNYVARFDVDNLYIYSGESYSVLFTTNKDHPSNYWISISVIGREPLTPQGLAILHYVSASTSKFPTDPPPQAPKWNDYDEFKKFSKEIHALTGSQKPPTSSDQQPQASKWNAYDEFKEFFKKILAFTGSPKPPTSSPAPSPSSSPPPTSSPAPSPSSPPPLSKPYQQIVLLNTQNNMDGFTKWSINGISLALPSTPLLGAIKYDLHYAFDQNNPPDHYTPADYHQVRTSNGTYKLDLNNIVDVILQNPSGGKNEIHPWHLHGHDFWVLAYGEGNFTKENENSFVLTNPPLRNTAVVFPNGWTALRFKADNPGVWAFHCHIEPHLHLGMGVVFLEAEEKLKELPISSDGLVCGLVAKKLIPDTAKSP